MLCKNHKIMFGTSFLVSCLALLFSVFLFTDNSYATDYTYNFSSSNPTEQQLCVSDSSWGPNYPVCSTIKSIKFTVSSLTNNLIRPSFAKGSNGCSSLTNYSLYQYFDLGNSVIIIPDSSTFCGLRFGSSWSWNGNTNASAEIVLSTEESGSCPEPEEPEPCPECQVCPAIPENPYDNKFDEVIKAIYTVGAILLVIYFFYCMYRMIIRNSGVK